MKTEESLISQELIVDTAYSETKQLAESKRTKLIVLQNQKR